MGYKKAEKHTISIGFAASNPADSTEYRFLTETNPLTVPAFNPTFFLENVVITKIFLSMRASNTFTDEAWTILLRNNTISTDIITMNVIKYAAGLNATAKCEYEGGILCAKGVYQFKTTTPAWATDPTAIEGIGFIEYIEL